MVSYGWIWTTHLGEFALTANDDEAIAVVAARMRSTLIEVLGEDRGGSMYSIDWLVDRVRFHLDPARSQGVVFVVEDDTRTILAHAILRVEAETPSEIVGLFSTIYGASEHRRRGLARALIEVGQAWILEHGLSEAVTYTHTQNKGLQQLLNSLGYVCRPISDDFVRLSKALSADLRVG